MKLGLSLGFGCVLLSHAFANGTRLPYQDMNAVARGFAFAATADSPGAIYYNPAGLGQFKEGAADAGVYFLRPETRFRGSGGRDTSAKTETFTVPYLFAAQPVPLRDERRIVLGAGMYAPFGLSSEWSPTATGFRTLATTNALVFRRYALSAAAPISRALMLGASLQYNRVHADLSRGIGFVPGDRINFTGRGHAWSWNAGLLYQPVPEHSFGVQYQARTDVTLDGTTSYAPMGFGEASSVRWPFPDHFTIGYSYRPTPAWNFEIGYDRTNWSRFAALNVNRAVSGPLPLVFNWKDSAYYEIGGTWHGPKGWSVSAGGCWSENSIPDATFNPTVVDYDRWFWCTGVAYRARSWKVSTLLQYSPTHTRTVSGSLRSAAGESADGSYEASLVVAGVQVECRW